VVQGRYLEVERYKEELRDWTMPLCNGEEDVVRILLKCVETRRLRGHLLSRKWQIINEELAYMKIINCTNTVELRNLDGYLYKIKCKWENRIK
jgi:hypothetical protein